MSTGQQFLNGPSSTHLPYNGSMILDGSNLNRNIDLKLSFDTENDMPPNPHPLPTVATLKPAHSVSQISLPCTDDGIEHGIHPDNNHSQPLVDRRSGSSFLQSLIPSSLTCRLYLSVVLLETFIDLVIEGMLLVRVHSVTRNEQKSQDAGEVLISSQLPVLLAIFCLAHVFQFAFALDAVHQQNVLQFIFLAIFNALLFAYSVMQIFEIQNTASSVKDQGISINTLTSAIPIVILIAQVAYMALGWRIYKEFGWNVYKQIGADRRIKKLYARYQIFESLVRFDAFFWLGFSVQLVSLVLEKGDFEFYLTIAALPLSMLLLLEGHLAVRHESRPMMFFFAFGLVAALVYFSYKLFRIWTRRHTPTFKNIWKSLSLFCCLSIALLIITAIWTILVFHSFGQGLKENLNKNDSRNKRNNDMEMGSGSGKRRYPAGANRNRMSIE